MKQWSVSFLTLFFAAFFSQACAHGKPISCNGSAVEYVPKEYEHKRGDFFDYKLRIGDGDKAGTGADETFTLFFSEHATGKKLGSKSFNYMCSMGVVTCSLIDPEVKEVWARSIDITGLQEDFSPIDPVSPAYAIIIPQFGKFIRDPNKLPKEARDYTNSLSEDEIAKSRPDIFVPHVWIFNRCQGKE